MVIMVKTIIRLHTNYTDYTIYRYYIETGFETVLCYTYMEGRWKREQIWLRIPFYQWWGSTSAQEESWTWVQTISGEQAEKQKEEEKVSRRQAARKQQLPGSPKHSRSCYTKTQLHNSTLSGRKGREFMIKVLNKSKKHRFYRSRSYSWASERP